MQSATPSLPSVCTGRVSHHFINGNQRAEEKYKTRNGTMNVFRMAHFPLTIRKACLYPDVLWHLNNNEEEVAE